MPRARSPGALVRVAFGSGLVRAFDLQIERLHGRGEERVGDLEGQPAG